MSRRNNNLQPEDGYPPNPPSPSDSEKLFNVRRITRSSTENRSPKPLPQEDELEDAHTPDLIGSNVNDPVEANRDEAEISEEEDERSSLPSLGKPIPTGAPISKSSSQEPLQRSMSSLPSQDSKHPSDSLPSTSTRQKPLSSQNQSSNVMPALAWVIIAVVAYCMWSFVKSTSESPSKDEDWRAKVDPNDQLPDSQRSMVRASLKPILGQPSTSQDISTLLILSSNEEVAAKLGRCLLPLVNSQSNKDQTSAEIDLQKHRGGKLALDSTLQTLLNSTDGTRAVLLRNIGDTRVEDALNQLRLLFAYCDGENPVIRHRLFIMTAASDSTTEDGLRQKFKNYWPQEHDFVDALMSRISGHTLYLSEEQNSIC